MDPPVFLLLVFSGLSILPSYLPHQFHFVNMKMTWTEAQSICRQNYTDLATIDDDMADMNKLNNTIAATSSWGGSAWIGLYDIIWRWCLGNRNLKGMGFWLDGKPKQPHVCVSMMLNGSWHDDNCDSLWPFVCYDEKQTKVIKRYILITVKKTWSEAQSYCRKEHTKLASVTNAAEVEAILKPDNNQPVLFDLKKYCGVWSDQSGSSYRNWDSDEPNWGDGGDYCGEVKSSGMWNDAGCHHTKNFICYDDELVLVSENKTWSEALWHCRDLDMELVSAHNQSIQHWVQQRAKKASTPFVWLGLRYTCTLDFWFWVNGEESCYHNWANGEGYNTGKEQCGNTGAIQRDGGQWVGKSETERFNFICSKSDDPAL